MKKNPLALAMGNVNENAIDASRSDEFDLGVRLITPDGAGLGNISVETRNVT